MSASISSAPASARAIAIARPMPCAAPETSATRPVRSKRLDIAESHEVPSLTDADAVRSTEFVWIEPVRGAGRLPIEGFFCGAGVPPAVLVLRDGIKEAVLERGRGG